MCGQNNPRRRPSEDGKDTVPSLDAYSTINGLVRRLLLPIFYAWFLLHARTISADADTTSRQTPARAPALCARMVLPAVLRDPRSIPNKLAGVIRFSRRSSCAWGFLPWLDSPPPPRRRVRRSTGPPRQPLFWMPCRRLHRARLSTASVRRKASISSSARPPHRPALRLLPIVLPLSCRGSKTRAVPNSIADERCSPIGKLASIAVSFCCRRPDWPVARKMR